MTGQEYANYLKDIEKRKDDALCKVAATYADDKKNLWGEFIKSFPIKKGDTVKTLKKVHTIIDVEFHSHSCAKSPLPIFHTSEGQFISIKDVKEHNAKPFHYEDWVAEK